MNLSIFNPGTKLLSRDGRIFVLVYKTDLSVWLKFGPSVDEISSWNFDGTAEDDNFISDADIVSVYEPTLF